MSAQQFLAPLKPEEIDQIWIPLMQAVQHAKDTVQFYEQQLDQGAPVSVASLERAKQDLLAKQAEEKPLQEEFLHRGGWSRVWLAVDGSMHQEQDCAGEHAQILSYLSGSPLEQVVARIGLKACDKCFRGLEELPEYQAIRRQAAREDECPGSRRKAQDDLCPECQQPAGVTPKGRVKVHQAAQEALI